VKYSLSYVLSGVPFEEKVVEYKSSSRNKLASSKSLPVDATSVHRILF
tara:strand:+ start:750 stop:893 length:144 start_codon:yes stop_codon:yes gene_type:complete